MQNEISEFNSMIVLLQSAEFTSILFTIFLFIVFIYILPKIEILTTKKTFTRNSRIKKIPEICENFKSGNQINKKDFVDLLIIFKTIYNFKDTKPESFISFIKENNSELKEIRDYLFAIDPIVLLDKQVGPITIEQLNDSVEKIIYENNLVVSMSMAMKKLDLMSDLEFKEIEMSNTKCLEKINVIRTLFLRLISFHH